MLTTMTSKGQVTLPKKIRDALGLAPGAKLDFTLEPDGTVRIRALQKSALSVAGILHRPGMKALTIEEMDAGIARAVAERDARSKQ